MPTLSFAEQMNLCEVLGTNLTPHLEAMPHLGVYHKELVDLVAMGRTLESQRGFHEAELRETNAKRRDIDQRARNVRSRLAAALQSNFGPTSERLLEFGLKPRARRRKAKKTGGEGESQKPRSPQS